MSIKLQNDKNLWKMMWKQNTPYYFCGISDISKEEILLITNSKFKAISQTKQSVNFIVEKYWSYINTILIDLEDALYENKNTTKLSYLEIDEWSLEVNHLSKLVYNNTLLIGKQKNVHPRPFCILKRNTLQNIAKQHEHDLESICLL